MNTIDYLYSVADTIDEHDGCSFIGRDAGITGLFGKAKEWASKLNLPITAVKNILSLKPTQERLDSAAKELQKYLSGNVGDLGMAEGKEAAQPWRQGEYFVRPRRDPQSLQRQTQKYMMQQRKTPGVRQEGMPSYTVPNAPAYPWQSALGQTKSTSPTLRSQPQTEFAYGVQQRPKPTQSTRLSPGGALGEQGFQRDRSKMPSSEPYHGRPATPSDRPGIGSKLKFRIRMLIFFLLLFGGPSHKNVAEQAIQNLPQIEQRAEQAPAPIPQEKKLSIYFNFDKHDIRETEKGKIGDIVEYLKQNPSSDVNLSGNASAPGSNEYNMILSKKRAESVANVIKSQLPDWSGKVNIRFYGEEKPIGKTNQENQRVDVEITPSQQVKTASDCPSSMRVVLSYMRSRS